MRKDDHGGVYNHDALAGLALALLWEMVVVNEDILLAAAHWHLQSSADDMDWTGFTEWLEADPDHRDAYDAIALDDALLDDLRPQIARALSQMPQTDIVDISEARRRRRWLPWAGGAVGTAVAAGFAAALLLPGTQPSAPDSRQVSAPVTGMRQIAFAGDAHMTLARGSSLDLSGSDQSDLTLQGTGYFSVPHQPGRQIVIHAGEFQVVDLGTRFEIANTKNTLRVAVAEGAVSLRSAKLPAPMQIKAGQAVVVLKKLGTVQQMSATPATVGSFRKGQLVYEDMPLPVVTAELHRYSGKRIVLAPGLEQRRFSGALAVNHGSELVTDLAKLMDLRVSSQQNTIRLSAASGN